MIRPYRPTEDRETLWQLKRGFELTLGTATGGPEKGEIYREKLDAAYRERYLDWVGECVAAESCVFLAEREGEACGYAFLLPERLAMIWDAAVLNELYVEPEARGTGIADDLMAAVIEAAGEQSLPIERIVLDVDADNGRARAFYDRFGFESWGELVTRPLD